MPKAKADTSKSLSPFFYKGKTWTVIDGGLSQSVLLESETYPHQAMLTKKEYDLEITKKEAEKKNKRVYNDNKYRDYYK